MRRDRRVSRSDEPDSIGAYRRRSVMPVLTPARLPVVGIVMLLVDPRTVGSDGHLAGWSVDRGTVSSAVRPASLGMPQERPEA